jgi:integrase
MRRGTPLKPLGRVSPGQVNRSITQLLRRLMTRARKAWKVALPDEPNWTEHMLPEPRERVRELRYDEEARLEAVEREEYRAPRVFALITGLRRREITALTWSQVDFAAEVIRVIGKGDKGHEIPITPELHLLLWPLRGQHETHVFTYLCQRTRFCPKSKRRFVKGRRYPITYHGFSTHIRRGLQKAKITDFRIHDLRHTSATRTLRATKNLKLVQKLLNHSSLSVTEKYAHADLDDLREAMVETTADNMVRRTKSREMSRNGIRVDPKIKAL